MARTKRIKASERKAARQAQIDAYREKFDPKPLPEPKPTPPPAPKTPKRKQKNRIRAAERRATKQTKPRPKEPPKKPTPKKKYKENLFAPERKQGNKALAKEARRQRIKQSQAKAERREARVALERAAQEVLAESAKSAESQVTQPTEDYIELGEAAYNSFLQELRFYPDRFQAVVMEAIRPVVEEYGRAKAGQALLDLPNRWIEYFQSSQYDSGQGAMEFQSALLTHIPQDMADMMATDQSLEMETGAE